MFIRCNELNIPAIIGVGEKQYNNMLKTHNPLIQMKGNFFLWIIY